MSMNQNVYGDNGNDGYVFTCSRCGSEMNSNSRYCMKCGNLNPNHPDNKAMSKYLGKETYEFKNNQQVLSQVNANIITAKSGEIAFASHSGNYNLCFFINIILYILSIGATVFYFYNACNSDFNAIVHSECYYYVAIITISFLNLYAMELLFMKMNRQWWLSLIPVVNIFVFASVLQENKWLNLLLLVPVVGEIYYIYLYCKMLKAFKKSIILGLLFPGIMLLVIAFGSAPFNNLYYVSGRGSLEKEYKKKRVFLVLSIVIIVISIITFIYGNASEISIKIDTNKRNRYVTTAKKLVESISNHVENDNYHCIYDSDTLYFYYENVFESSAFGFDSFSKPIEGYVKVLVTNNYDGSKSYQYFVSMTDNTYGFEEIAIEELDIDKVVEYESLVKVYDYGNMCQI